MILNIKINDNTYTKIVSEDREDRFSPIDYFYVHHQIIKEYQSIEEKFSPFEIMFPKISLN